MSGKGEQSPLISPALAIGLVVVSALSLIGYFALSAYAPDFRNPSNGEANALSSSAIGFAGLRILLDEEGVRTEIDRGYVFARGPRGLTILTPEITSSSNKIKSLCGTGPCLVILPKWIPVSDPTSRGRVVKFATFPAEAVQSLLAAFSKSTRIAQRKDTVPPKLASDFGWLVPAHPAPIDSLQTLSGKDWFPAIKTASGDILLAHLVGSEIYVLAEPDIMNTQGLANLQTAAMASYAVGELRVWPRSVSFDVTLNGLGGSPDILRYMFAPPFLGATLCALVAAMLIGFHAFARFGAPERPLPGLALGKARLVDNTAQLVRMMRREPNMAPRYAAAMKRLALRALGLQRRVDGAQIDAVLGALEKRAGERAFSSLSADAQGVRRNADLMRVAERLFRWRERIVHGR